MKNQKGVALIYIIVVALILVIIGGVAYLGASNEHAMKIAELKKKEEANKSTEQDIEIEEEIANNDDIVPVYTPEQFSLVGSGEEVYVEQTGKVYLFGIDKKYMFYGVAEEFSDVVKEKLTEQLKNEIKVEMNKEGAIVTAIRTQEAEEPRLASNMVAVYWSKDGGITASTFEEGANPIYSKIDANGNPSSTGTVNPSFREENWYEYNAGYSFLDTKTSRWANGVTDDGSYWVWIPRFKYKITDRPDLTDATSAGKVDVKFISVAEKSGTTIYKTSKNNDGEFITVDEEGYILHPAFENGSSSGAKAQGQSEYVEYNNGEWDSEIAGFWMAKYEMSMEDGSGTAVIPTDGATGNLDISSTVKMVSKANRTAWTYIKIGKMYENSYKYNRANESHLIKNSEWGAIAYLTHSQYGRNGHEITWNNTAITASVGEEGSTTGNIYGVYDMSGGTVDRVAAWNTAYTGDYITNNANITVDGYAFGISGEKSTKYATAYENATNIYTQIAIVKKTSKIGDGIKETFISTSGSWFGDRSTIVNISYPYLYRGDSYLTTNEPYIGIFSQGNSGGTVSNDGGFRVVMIVE